MQALIPNLMFVRQTGNHSTLGCVYNMCKTSVGEEIELLREDLLSLFVARTTDFNGNY